MALLSGLQLRKVSSHVGNAGVGVVSLRERCTSCFAYFCHSPV